MYSTVGMEWSEEVVGRSSLFRRAVKNCMEYVLCTLVVVLWIHCLFIAVLSIMMVRWGLWSSGWNGYN